MSFAARASRSAQRLTRHFASGGTVTLKSKAKARLIQVPLEDVPAVFTELSFAEILAGGLETGSQPIAIASADLGSFVLDGSCLVVIGGQPYAFSPLNELGTSPASRAMVRGYIRKGKN